MIKIKIYINNDTKYDGWAPLAFKDAKFQKFQNSIYSEICSQIQSLPWGLMLASRMLCVIWVQKMLSRGPIILNRILIWFLYNINIFLRVKRKGMNSCSFMQLNQPIYNWQLPFFVIHESAVSLPYVFYFPQIDEMQIPTGEMRGRGEQKCPRISCPVGK